MNYRKGSFTIIPNLESLRGKEPSILSTYFWICSHANEKGICFPSLKTLAEESGTSISTIGRCLKELESIGILSKESRRKGKENLSNTYQIMLIDKGGTLAMTIPPPQDDYTPPPQDDNVTISIVTIPKKGIDARKTSRPFGNLGEDVSSDSYENVIDADSGLLAEVTPKGSSNKSMISLLNWAVERRGSPFVSLGKQYKAMSMLKKAKINPGSIKNRWVELEGDPFHQKNGIDFMDIVRSFDRR